MLQFPDSVLISLVISGAGFGIGIAPAACFSPAGLAALGFAGAIASCATSVMQQNAASTINHNTLGMVFISPPEKLQIVAPSIIYQERLGASRYSLFAIRFSPFVLRSTASGIATFASVAAQPHSARDDSEKPISGRTNSVLVTPPPSPCSLESEDNESFPRKLLTPSGLQVTALFAAAYAALSPGRAASAASGRIRDYRSSYLTTPQIGNRQLTGAPSPSPA